MSTNSSFASGESIQELIRSEIKEFAREFLPSIEESVRSVERTNLLAEQVASLEHKISNMRGLVQGSLVQVEQLNKTFAHNNIEKRRRVQVIGKKQKARSREPAEKNPFDKNILEKEVAMQNDFIRRLYGQKIEDSINNNPVGRTKINAVKEKRFRRSKSRKAVKGISEEKKRCEIRQRSNEKRIVSLEVNQKMFEEVVTKKLDLVIKEVKKVGLTRKEKKKSKVSPR